MNIVFVKISVILNHKNETILALIDLKKMHFLQNYKLSQPEYAHEL